MSIFKKAKAKHWRLGQSGEKAARRLLKAKHIDVLACNYRSKRGEIDIVARDGETLAFIEVKTRRDSTKSRPARGLTERQKSRIYRSAFAYMQEIEKPNVIYRFDLIEVIVSRWGIKEIRQWYNHFGVENYKKYRKRINS